MINYTKLWGQPIPYKTRHLRRESNDTTGWSATGITGLQRVWVATLTQVIGTGVNNDSSSQNGVFTEKLDQAVLLCTLGNSIGVGSNVTKVTNVSLGVFWCTMVFAEWVEVWSSRSAAVSVVTKLVDVETSQSVWIVTGNFP
ncbi:hypothetical protein OGATHE_002764 [Ogataea polymorpha]|uniref:Uncharacterized protein n=1 Tax=Ogataea polymorpha TaxID=460523 RepID=A0A9P8T9E5_9ASCO|nr:hypothetical protein OGATHE_002764 [Ogataea polymorpha]